MVQTTTINAVIAIMGRVSRGVARTFCRPRNRSALVLRDTKTREAGRQRGCEVAQAEILCQNSAKNSHGCDDVVV
jgi:hypothetical protein